MKARDIKKIIGGGLVALGLAMMPVGAQAWGPERATFTNDNPATYITFNSITNNAAGGDERNFVRVREKGVGDFVDSVKIAPGKTYEVQIYYHNNAGSKYNLTATDTKVSAYYPGVVTKDLPGKVGAMISSKDAKPVSVWDEADFVTDETEAVSLQYVANTAKLHNTRADSTQREFVIDSTKLFSNTGALIGYDTMDGRLPGCAEYSGTITFEVEATQAKGYLYKEVSLDQTNYHENVNAKVGDTVYYRLTGKNLGSAKLTSVTVKDVMTTGLASTSKALFSNASQKNVALDGFFQPTGQNVGSLSVGGAGWVIEYAAKVTSAALGGAECGAAKLVNAAYMDYLIEGETDEHGSPMGNTMENHASVTVNVPCPETATEMPKTGGDFGELIMTMAIAVAGVGLITYVVFGVRLVKKRQVVYFDDQTNMKGLGI